MDAMCDVDGTDPFTMSARLCDDDGIVRRGAMHHGTDYPCTSHAHFGGEHIRCTSPAHRPQPYSGTWVYETTGPIPGTATVVTPPWFSVPFDTAAAMPFGTTRRWGTPFPTGQAG